MRGFCLRKLFLYENMRCKEATYPFIIMILCVNTWIFCVIFRRGEQ